MANNQGPAGYPPASPNVPPPVAPAFSYEAVYKDFVGEKLDQDLHAFDKMFNTPPTLQYDDVWVDFEIYLRVRDQGLLSKFDKDASKIGMMRELFVSAFPIHFLREELTSIFTVEQGGQGSFDSGKLVDYLETLKLSDLKALRAIYEQRILESKQAGILSDVEAQDLIDNNEGEKLLEKIFGSSVPQNIIIGGKDILEKYLNGQSVSGEDVKTLFALFDLGQKKDFLKYWIPAISVESLLQNSIYTKQEAKLKVKEKIGNEISQGEYDMMFSKLDLSCFFVKVDELSDSQIEDLAKNDNMCSVIARAYDKPREDKEKKETNEKLEAPITSLADFQYKLQNNPKLSTLPHAKLIAGNTLLLTKGESKNYFLIDSIDDTQVVLNNRTYENRVVHVESGTKETMTLQKFYEMLLATQDNGQVSMEILDASEFDALGLQAVPELDKIRSKQALEALMNEVDKEGKDVGEPFHFQCKRKTSGIDAYLNDKIETFTVTSIDDQFVKLEGQSPMTLTDFAEAFSNRECKRFKNIDGVGTLFNMLSTHKDYEGTFKDYEVKDDKIVHKSTQQPVTDFVDNDNIFRIDSFESTGVNLEVGGKGKDGYKCETKGENIPFRDVYMYFLSNKFKPSEKIIQKSDSVGGKDIKNHRGLFKRYMSGLSMIEIIAGGKQFIRAIEDHLKTGNRLKTAQFASFLGKALPEEVQFELNSSVNSEKKKVMDEQVSKLKEMNTGEMLAEIVKILEHSKPLSPQLEAALMTVTSKYGMLYPKDLAVYRGSFRWYKALGGKVGDKLYKEVEAGCTDFPFTEERLIERLLAGQVIRKQRRYKFDKEYGGNVEGGIKAELADGGEKTDNFASATRRLNHAMGEMINGTFYNAIGGMEKVWAKGPDPDWLMNTIPFVLISTGISMSFDQKIINHVKKMSFMTPYSQLTLISNNENIELYNSAISRIIELRFGVNHSMYKAFKSIFSSKVDKKRVESAYAFWKRYGSQLYPTLNLKDGFIASRFDEKKEPILSQYFNKIKGIRNADDNLYNNLDRSVIKDGAINHSNHSVAATKSLLRHIQYREGGVFADDIADKVFTMYLDYFQNTVCNGSEVEEAQRRKLFDDTYQYIERTLLYEKLSGFFGRGKEDSYKTWPVYKVAKAKGITLLDDKFQDSNERFDQDRYKKEVLDVEWEKLKRGSARRIADVQNVTRQSFEEILKAA